jgi:RNA polymerase sigma-70 factor (ECF subfamily)
MRALSILDLRFAIWESCARQHFEASSPAKSLPAASGKNQKSKIANRKLYMRDLDFDIDDCVARVRRRDQDAAHSLVEYLYPVVIGIVRRKLPRGGAEEDLVQEIFLKVFEKLDQYRGEVPLNHWVSRIAVNHCLNAIRARRVRPEWRMADLSQEQEAAIDPGSMTMEQAHPAHSIGLRELVETILATLSPEDGVLMRMLEIEDLSVAEVRQATGWSARYIRVRAFRARQKLHRRFRRLKKQGSQLL